MYTLSASSFIIILNTAYQSRNHVYIQRGEENTYRNKTQTMYTLGRGIFGTLISLMIPEDIRGTAMMDPEISLRTRDRDKISLSMLLSGKRDTEITLFICLHTRKLCLILLGNPKQIKHSRFDVQNAMFNSFRTSYTD